MAEQKDRKGLGLHWLCQAITSGLDPRANCASPPVCGSFSVLRTMLCSYVRTHSYKISNLSTRLQIRKSHTHTHTHTHSLTNHSRNKFSNCVLKSITAQHRNLRDNILTKIDFCWRSWKGRNNLYMPSFFFFFFFTFEKLLLRNYKLFPFKENYAQWSPLGPEGFWRLFHF